MRCGAREMDIQSNAGQQHISTPKAISHFAGGKIDREIHVKFQGTFHFPNRFKNLPLHDARFIPRAPHWRGKWSDVFLPPLNGYFADTAPDRKPPVRRGPPPHPPGPQAEADAEAEAEAEADAEGDKEREGEGILARLSPGRTRFLINSSGIGACACGSFAVE